MGDDVRGARALDEVVAESLIDYPNGTPYSHITFTLVAWNEEKRLGALLERVRPVFEKLIVGVQKSTDSTLEIARKYADIVVEDEHHGFGDATYGQLLKLAQTPWVLKLDADEWPSDDLLVSLSSATWTAQNMGADGVWIPFRSWIENKEWEEQHSHLRLFRPEKGWPALLHSRPPIENGILWHTGFIEHSRNLPEMLDDYLRYYEVGKGNAQWETHNKMMMRSAVLGTAEHRGWQLRPILSRLRQGSRGRLRGNGNPAPVVEAPKPKRTRAASEHHRVVPHPGPTRGSMGTPRHIRRYA